jgi:hypothetical protein
MWIAFKETATYGYSSEEEMDLSLAQLCEEDEKKNKVD